MRKLARLGLLFALSTGCASTAARPHAELPPPSATAELATRLADAAELRTDPNHMRVGTLFRASDDRTVAIVAPEIEREVVTTLAGRFHLFEADLSEATLDELATRLDVTHGLVCDAALRGEAIVLSLRLVEHGTRRIVASVQGDVPLAQLTDRNRMALLAPAEPSEAAVVAAIAPPGAAEHAGTQTALEPILAASATEIEVPPANIIESIEDGEPVATVTEAEGRTIPNGKAPSKAVTTRGTPQAARTTSEVARGPAYYRLKAMGRPLRRD